MLQRCIHQPAADTAPLRISSEWWFGYGGFQESSPILSRLTFDDTPTATSFMASLRSALITMPFGALDPTIKLKATISAQSVTSSASRDLEMPLDEHEVIRKRAVLNQWNYST